MRTCSQRGYTEEPSNNITCLLRLFRCRISSDFKHQLRHNKSIKNWTPDVGYSQAISDSDPDTFPYRIRFAMGPKKQFVFLSMENKQDSLNETVRPSGGCDIDVGYYLAVHSPQDFPAYLQLRMHLAPSHAFHSFVQPKAVQAAEQIRKYAVSK